EGRCGQNVAWLVSGVHAYAEDHGGSLPPADSWLEVIGPYLDDEKGPQGTTGNCRYAYNAALSGRKLADLRHPGRLVAVFETTPWGDMEDPWAAAGNQQQLSENPGHLEGDYYGFADGDHRWLARRRLPDGAWGKEPEADWVVWEP
ncbi:MAG: hypothetical protein JSV79_12960, partial [Armatimonadota bacterium]